MNKSKFKRYLVTSALPYANGGLHIGHLAGCLLPADIYARFLRSKQCDVKFICGSDEHGVPIAIAAKKEHTTPKNIVDKYHYLNKRNLENLGISFDIFSRTSNELHKKRASDFFLKLYNDGILIEKEVEQYFDETANEFLADRYIIGICPKCGNERAYGDQCEKCGNTLSPVELINPKSTISGNKPVLKKTKHWYFPLSKYEKWLKEWILEEHKDWKVNVFGQCMSWLEQGLLDRPITRDLNWGVNLPLENTDGKVLYVWFDAPIGYISFTEELLGDEYKKYWEDNGTKLVHFIGKDNIVFHSIFFPAMLKAHGNFILPEDVVGNEFMNLEGDKISTSRNHAIWLEDFLKQYENKQDVLRYVLCVNMPETKDADFTWEDFKNKNNNELVANFGNFVNRVVTMIIKNFNGEINYSLEDISVYNYIFEEVNDKIKIIEECLEKYRFREALLNVMNIAKIGNKFLAEEQPWLKIKIDIEKTKIVLYVCAQIIAKLAIVCEPFLPFTAKKICKILNIQENIWELSYKNNILKNIKINNTDFLFQKF